MKLKYKEKAVLLRQKGLSYTEILQEIPVAKSTLSLWLRSVGLAKEQQQRLTSKKLEAILRGARKKREQRIMLTAKIKREAALEVQKIDNRDLWLMGTMLYWAEGSKEKIYKPGQGLIFSNSDPFMIRLFLKWLTVCLHMPVERIVLELYIHTTHSENLELIKVYWSKITGFPIAKFDRIYYKQNKIATKRKNIGNTYRGLIRVKVTKSSELNRKISGWIEEICKQCGVV